MRIYELAIVLLEFRQAAEQEEWLANWQRELADSLPTVIQWALGRVPAEVRRRLPQDRLPGELAAAALFFVKRTCFAADANHYQVFGLTPGPVSHGALRARYRALIRLTHPDVGVKGLPANAAGRVNRAYAVLGDDSARRAYDNALAAAEPGPARPVQQGVATPERDVNRSTGHRSVRKWEGRARARHRAGLGERILARWAWINARWSRQLRVSLLGMAIVVPLGLIVFWNVSETREMNTIVALAPDSGSVGNTMISDEVGQGAAMTESRAGRPAQPSTADLRAQAAMGEAERTTDGERVRAAAASNASPAPGVAPKENPGPMADALPKRQVDWPAARRYLQDITLAVGDKSETLWLNHYLEQMNVRGSLLRPIIVLHDRYGSVSTQYSTWSMVEGHGLFDAETTLTVHALSEQGSQAALSFVLRAQFQATDEGTRLEALDLLPVE